MKDQEVKVLLEDLRAQFRVFGEGLQFVREKVEKIDARLTRVEERLDAVYFMTAKNTEAITRLEGRMDKLETRMDSLETRMDSLEGEVRGMKDEMRIMRSHLLGKVDREEFTGLEKRVGVLEQRRN